MKKAYELSESEWVRKYKEARAQLAGNYVPERITGRSASAMVGPAKVLHFLSFGIPEEKNFKLIGVQSGTIKLSEFGRLRFISELKKPVSYKRVRIKAKRLGLI